MSSLMNVNDLLRELYANASFYEQTSNSSDPRISYYLTQTYAILKSSIKTNFSFVVANSFARDISPILKYGTIPCSSPKREAYMDTNFSCFLYQLPYFLENIQFGYICSIVILPIIAISIFGKIKESYRWFLLNQAIWDAFMCYSFICERPTELAWSGIVGGKYTCFYSANSTSFLNIFFVVLRGSFKNAPYIPLFLLAFSRCISLYFPNFYQRNNKTWKILVLIISFNLGIMLISSFPQILSQIIELLKAISQENCFSSFCPGYANFSAKFKTDCSKKYEKYFQCANQMNDYYEKFKMQPRFSQISIAPIMFLMVLICVILLFVKISFQLKYQLKHNRQAFLQTIKVATIILLQTFTLTIYLSITTFQTYLAINALGEYIDDMTIYQRLSPGLFLLQNVTTSLSFNIIRIFFDSFIVLTVLSGYRKRVFKVFMLATVFIKKLFGKKQSHISTLTTVKSFHQK